MSEAALRVSGDRIRDADAGVGMDSGGVRSSRAVAYGGQEG